jgi:AcrR family transcriptional regulator
MVILFYAEDVAQELGRSIQTQRAVPDIEARAVPYVGKPGAGARVDRRVRRTRAVLHAALLELILRKGYSSISVQDILDEADVGRSTFYAHYRSKDDLLFDGWEDFRAEFAAQVHSSGEDARLLDSTLMLFRHVQDHRQLYRAMVGMQGSELVERSMRKLLSEMVADQLRGRLHVALGLALGVVGQEGSERDDQRLELAVQFMVGGLIGLLTWWLEADAAYTAEEMQSRFQRLATPGVELFLRDPRR